MKVGHTSPSDQVPRPERLVFLDIARTIAAWSIFYSHLDIIWLRRDHQISTKFTDAVATYLTGPLHIGLQGIGQIGVPLFFIISGYVVPSLALKLGGRRFLINRLLRIYPMLALTVGLASLLVMLGVPIISAGQQLKVTPMSVLTNLLLVNYLIFPQVVLVGVAWTLVIEIISYLVLLLVLPCFRQSLWLGFVLALCVVSGTLATQSDFGSTWSLLAVNMSYLPALVIGQVVWALHRRFLHPAIGASLLAASWMIFVWGDLQDSGRPDRSYALCLMLAFLLFCIGLLAEGKLKQSQIWTLMSERTYSLYRLHGIVAFPILDVLVRCLPLLPSILIAVCFTLAAVELAYRFVERPSHRPARTWSGGQAYRKFGSHIR